MSAPDITRRRLLGAGAATAAAAAARAPLTGRPATETVAGGTPRFDLRDPAEPLVWRARLHEPRWMMQSFAIDNTGGRLYFAQFRPHSTDGDMWITETDLEGDRLGAMALHGFGHGVSIAAEPYDGGVHLWTESRVNTRSGFGTRLARFRFADGATVTPDSAQVRDRTPTLPALRTNPQPSIDPVHDRLLVRYKDAGAKARVAVFPLDDARAGRLDARHALADVRLPDSSDAAGRDQWVAAHPFQGFAGLGRHVYLLEGTTSATSYLTCWDIGRGRLVADRVATRAGRSLHGREPEGMAIQLADGRPRLAFGLHSGTFPDYRASVFHKDRLVSA